LPASSNEDSAAGARLGILHFLLEDAHSPLSGRTRL
jgi:hypothetical protein